MMMVSDVISIIEFGAILFLILAITLSLIEYYYTCTPMGKRQVRVYTERYEKIKQAEHEKQKQLEQAKHDKITVLDDSTGRKDLDMFLSG